MRDWVVILLIGLASLAVGGWLLRQRRLVSGSVGHEAADDPASTPDRVSRPVTNTHVPPLPEYEVLGVLEFEGPPGRVPIRRGESVIGRHSDDDVRVQDVRVSRHHARIVAGERGSFEIHNLTAVRSEPNPMLVNGQSREHAEVVDGDVITLGGVSFTFRQAADADRLPTQKQRDNT